MTLAIIPAIYMLPESMDMTFGGVTYHATNWKLYGCIMMGLWSGMIIGASTEYYTSNKYSPTKDLAQSCEYGPALTSSRDSLSDTCLTLSQSSASVPPSLLLSTS